MTLSFSSFMSEANAERLVCGFHVVFTAIVFAFVAMLVFVI